MSAAGASARTATLAAGERMLSAIREYFAWILLALGAVLMPLVPPLQSPDEGDHIKRVYALSDGQWLPETPAGGQSGYRIDRGLALYVDANCYFVRFECAPQLDAGRRARLEAIAWTGERVFATAPGTGYYFPAIYLPQAAGLGLARSFGLSVDASYRWARLGSLLAAVVLLAAAFRLQPPNVLAMTILLLPMVLFQSVAASQDAVATALAVLAASAFVRGMDRAAAFGNGASLLLAGSVFLLATGRIYLLPLAALPVLVGIARRSRRDVVAGIVVAVFALAWFAFAAATTVDTRMARELGTGAMAAHYLAHPLELAGVLWTTVADATRLVEYRDQFVGVLGWLDTRLPEAAYPALTGAVLAAAVLSWPPRGTGPACTARITLVASALAASVLVFLALLFGWTPYPATVVLGVQGRYFIVPALLVAYALAARAPLPSGGRAVAGAGLLVVLLLTVPALTASTLLGRYWLAAPAEGSAEDVFRQRPSTPLAGGAPIVLHGFAAGRRPLVAIDIAFGTYARVNAGRAVLRLERADGEVWRQPFALADLEDNRYLRFEVPRGHYVSGAIETLDGGGISVWEAHAADGGVRSCIVSHYAGGLARAVPGCRLPRLPAPPPAGEGRR